MKFHAALLPQLLHLQKSPGLAGKQRAFPGIPTEEELRRWQGLSGLPLKRFFNTSGLSYKSLQLKDKLPKMSEGQQFALLSTDGMLVKRPLLIGDGFVLVGFREGEWEAALT